MRPLIFGREKKRTMEKMANLTKSNIHYITDNGRGHQINVATNVQIYILNDYSKKDLRYTKK